MTYRQNIMERKREKNGLKKKLFTLTYFEIFFLLSVPRALHRNFKN